MTWDGSELEEVGRTTELELAARRPDDTLSRYTVMWAVRVGSSLYVRSAGGPDRPWYRQATAAGAGRIHAGGVERDVMFADADPGVHEAIDAAYHRKYDRYGPGPVSHVTGPDAHPVTIRLVKSEA